MASSINSILGTSSAASSASSSSASGGAGLGAAAPSQAIFLQLLVAQMKNQDPLNPADSTAFVTQLAQFSQLEQDIAIRSNTDILVAAVNSSKVSVPSSGATATPSLTVGTNDTATPTQKPITNS